MKTKSLKWIAFSTILLFYAFLYIATSPNKPDLYCGDTCEKFAGIDTLLLKKTNVVRTSANSFYTPVGVEPKDTTFFIYVKDSLQSDWNGLADTACQYMNNVMLHQYRVIIMNNHNRKTVVDKKCP